MGAFQYATAQYYHEGDWTISQIRNELIMQGMSSAEAKKDIAKSLGVTVRSVERYLQQETGSGKQARGKKSLIAKQSQINALGDELIGPPEQNGEIVIKVKGKIRVKSPPKKRKGGDDIREREITLKISVSEWSELVRAANATDREAERVAQNYFFEDLYGVRGMSLINGVVSVT